MSATARPFGPGTGAAPTADPAATAREAVTPVAPTATAAPTLADIPTSDRRGGGGPVSVAALLVLTVVATLPLERIGQGGLLAALLAATSAAGVAVAATLCRARAPVAAVAYAAGLPLVTLAAVAAAARAAHLTGAPPALWLHAAAGGLPRLLSTLVPVPPTPDTVVLPVAAAWLAAVAAADLLLRSGRALAACLPAVLLYAGCLAVAGPAAPGRPWTAVAAATAAALVVHGGRQGRRPPVQPRQAVDAGQPGRAAPPVGTGQRAATGQPGGTGRRAGVGQRAATGQPGACGLTAGSRPARGAGVAATYLGVLAALTAAIAGPLVAALPARPADLRAHVHPPRLDTLDTHPLARLSGWALTPDLPLASIDLRAPAGVREVRLRLAVLTRFDGVGWRLDGGYRPAGPLLPAPPPPPGTEVAARRDGGTVVARVTCDALAGRLLPVPADPVSVDGLPVLYDPGQGTVLAADGLAPGRRYTATAHLTRPDPDRLGVAGVPAGPAVAGLLDLGPRPPDEVATLAQRATDGQAAPYARAVALESFLAAHYRLAPDAPGGHAYPNLVFFLTADPSQGGGRGTAEQFAASFAVLARALGLPSRVVVGLRARPGTGVLRAGAATAWPEVLFSGVGWVPFDPLPRPGTQPLPPEDLRPPPPVPQPSVSPTPPAPTPTRSPVPRAGAAGPGRTKPSPVWTVLAGVAGGAGAGAAIVVTGRAWLRRRRLAHGTPERRVAAAWALLGRALRRAGHPVPAHLSAAEVAALAGAVATAGPPTHPVTHPAGRGRGTPGDLALLASAVNQAVYGPQRLGPAGADAAVAAALLWSRRLRRTRPGRAGRRRGAPPAGCA